MLCSWKLVSHRSLCFCTPLCLLCPFFFTTFSLSYAMKICSLSWPIPRSQRRSWLEENFSEFESYLKFFYCGHSNLSGHLNSLMLYTSNQPLTFFFPGQLFNTMGKNAGFCECQKLDLQIKVLSVPADEVFLGKFFHLIGRNFS